MFFSIWITLGRRQLARESSRIVNGTVTENERFALRAYSWGKSKGTACTNFLIELARVHVTMTANAGFRRARHSGSVILAAANQRELQSIPRPLHRKHHQQFRGAGALCLGAQR